MSTNERGPAGFTLLELVVSLMTTAILVAGGLALFVSQQHVLQSSSTDRAIQETARTALGALTDDLRRAGFGVEPFRAFDFDAYACDAPVACRDRVDGPDEVVFHARDPQWSGRLAAAPAATSVSLVGGIQGPLRVGQILQLMCNGAGEWVYVTVAAEAAANWVPPATPPASTKVTLTAATGKFPEQNAAMMATGSCFQEDFQGVRVYRIERFRYFVQSFADAEGPRPYLMLDRGLKDGDGARVEIVSPDVEDLQIEYVFQDPTTRATRSVGSTESTGLSNSETSIDLAATPPTYDDRHDAKSRTTNHPANIRAVRVGIVARSPSIRENVADARVIPAAGNRPALTVTDGDHLRTQVESTAAVRNLEARAPYYQP